MILCIDSSGITLLLALVADGAVVAAAGPGGGRHQELIDDAIAALTDKHGGLPAVEALAVAVGPGSHTGLRVGLSTASGIAYARRLPIHPLSSLTVAAYRGGDAERVLAAVAAGRGRAHAQPFMAAGTALVPAGQPRLVAVSELVGRAEGVTLAASADLLEEALGAGATAAAGALRPGPEALAVAAIRAAGSGHALIYDQLKGEYGE